MARTSKATRLQSVHSEAMDRFNATHSAVYDERRQCIEDRRFHRIPGAQWEGFEDQFNNKPRFEFNKVHPAVRKITNEYRNNRLDVCFTSKDGTTDDKLADACAALFRSDEQDSSAEEAYDNAFDEALGGGMGAWRLRACYSDEDDEDGVDDQDEARPQRIRFEPIHDADISVFFDLNAKKQDKSDARYCFVLTSLTRSEYILRYDDDPASWPSMQGEGGFDWAPADVVFIAEYFVVETAPVTFITFTGLDGEEREHTEQEVEEDEDLARELVATGFTETNRRTIQRRRIHKYELSGNGVLKDCGYIAGRHIPIVPVFGEIGRVDGIERCMGVVRHAKDPQRVLNMTVSRIGEISAFSPNEKLIVTPDQIKGHEATWSDDHIKNRAYRLLNPLRDDLTGQMLPTQGPIGSVKPPEIPAATAALTQISDAGLRDVLGNSQESEKMLSHVAGKTVELLQQRIDGNAYIYISNMAKAIRRGGQIWLSMARDLYVEPGRKMKGIGARDELRQIVLMRPVVDPVSKQVTYEHDLSRANFDVAVNIGPSSRSKRDAAVRQITGMLPMVADPQQQSLLLNFALMNMEGEGVEGIRKSSRKRLVASGDLDPTPEEARQLEAARANAPPDPQAAYLEAAAKKQEADAAKAAAELDLTAAKTEKTKAETIETLAGVDVSRQAAAVDAAKSLHEITTQQAPSLDQAPRAGSEL